MYYAHLFKESKVMKYNMIIGNIRKMDNVYTKKNYTNKWKRKKRNDCTIKYNAKMSNNMELKTINVKGKEKFVYITKGNNSQHKFITEHEI